MKTPGVISLMHPLNELALTSDFIQGTALGIHTNHYPWQQGVYFILITPCFRNCGYLGTVAPDSLSFPVITSNLSILAWVSKTDNK